MSAMRFTIFSFLALMLLPVSDAVSRESGYAAMQGVGPVQQVFDFRVSDPKVALSHLNLIHSMLDDPSMMHEGKSPDTAVVLIGPSVRLVSTEDTGVGSQKRAVQEKVSAMEEEGVRFEICMTSAEALGIPADSIQPEVVQVDNGWISVVGYQHQGYALVAN